MLLQDVFEEVMCIKTCQCNDWHLTYLFIKCMTDLNDVLYSTFHYCMAHTAKRKDSCTYHSCQQDY